MNIVIIAKIYYTKMFDIIKQICDAVLQLIL